MKWWMVHCSWWTGIGKMSESPPISTENTHWCDYQHQLANQRAFAKFPVYFTINDTKQLAIIRNDQKITFVVNNTVDFCHFSFPKLRWNIMRRTFSHSFVEDGSRWSGILALPQPSLLLRILNLSIFRQTTNRFSRSGMMKIRKFPPECVDASAIIINVHDSRRLWSRSSLYYFSLVGFFLDEIRDTHWQTIYIITIIRS